MKKITTLLMASILAGCSAKYENIAKFVEQTGQHSREEFETIDEKIFVNGFSKSAIKNIKMGEKLIDGKKVPNMVEVEAKLIIDPTVVISPYDFKEVEEYKGMLVKYRINGNSPEYFLFKGYGGTPRMFTKYNNRFKEITEDNNEDNFDKRVDLAKKILKIFNTNRNKFYRKRNNEIRERNQEMETAINKQLYSNRNSYNSKPKKDYNTRKK